MCFTDYSEIMNTSFIELVNWIQLDFIGSRNIS